MKRKLVALMALLASLSLAQTAANPKVTVNIPSVLQLTLDATDYKFDFTDNTLTGTETVTVGGTDYTKASWAAYETFLNTTSGTKDFAPTSIEDAANPDYGTVTVLTNRAQWTVKIDSISGSLTLGNSRVKVFAEKVSGKGTSQTASPTSIASSLTLFSASSNGQGKSTYKLYYLFTMDINDDIPLSGISEYITINLLLTSP